MWSPAGTMYEVLVAGSGTKTSHSPGTDAAPASVFICRLPNHTDL